MTTEGDGRGQLGADGVDVAAAHRLHEADDDAGDDRAAEAVEPAERRRGERVDQHAAHEVRLEQRRAGDERAGQRADRGGQRPAELQRAPDVDAEQPARLQARRHRRGRRGRSSSCAAAGVTRNTADEHGDPGEQVGPLDLGAEERERLVAAGEQRREGPPVERPDDAGDGVEDEEQRQRDDDDGEVVARVERPDQHPLDDRRPERRQHHRDQHGHRAGDVEGVGDGVGDERADHRHLALGEVDDAGRLEDQHEREGHRRVDEAVAQAVEDALEEQLRAAVVDRPDGERERSRTTADAPARAGGSRRSCARPSNPGAIDVRSAADRGLGLRAVVAHVAPPSSPR